MSQLPTRIPTVEDDVPRRIRAIATDSVIAANRGVTPPEMLEKRAERRLSVSELNAMDIDQIRERFARTRYDDRGAVTKAIDILDVPRSFVLGRIIAPEIRKQREAEGHVGTFGEGKVYAADVLEKMGVENRVIRGILGFVGDVGLDLTTYLGPPGWGAKAAASGGRAVQWSKAFVKAAKAASKGKVTDPLIAEYLRHAAPEAGKVGEVLLGGGQTRGNKALRFLGADMETKGSMLAEDVFRSIDSASTPAEAARIRAAHAIEAAYSRTARPGIRIGPKGPGGPTGVEVAGRASGQIQAGTGVLHIPFTDIGLYVPAFTGRARAGVAASILSRELGDARREGVALTQQGQEAEALGREIDARWQGIRSMSDEMQSLDATDAAVRRGELPADPQLRTARQLRREQLSAEVTRLTDEIAGPQGIDGKRTGGLKDQVHQKLKELEAVSASPDALLYANKLWQARRGQTQVALGELAELREARGEAAKIVPLMDKERDALIEGRVGEMRGSHEEEARVPKIGDDVNWTSQGVAQFEKPRTLREIQLGPDGKHYGFVEGSDTGIPLDELNKTDPLPFDEAAARLRAADEVNAAYAAKLNDLADQRLADMSPESLDAMSKMQDALAARVAGYQDIADAAQVPLLQAMTSKDRAIADAAAMSMGLSPEEIGYAPFGGLKGAADGIFNRLADGVEGKGEWAKAAGFWTKSNLTDVEAGLRKTFGNKSGLRHEIMRNFIRSQNAMHTETAAAKVAELEQAVGGLMKKHNIDPKKAADVRRMAFLMLDTERPVAALSENDRLKTILAEVATSGMLSEKIHPGLAADLQELAKKLRADLDELRMTEGGAFRADYGAPTKVSAAGKKYLLAQKASAGSWQPSTPTHVGGKVIESYEKPRTLVEYRWQGVDAEGNPVERSFLEGDRIWATLSNEDIAELSPDAQKYAEGIRKTIAEYEAMPYSKRPEGISLSRAEANARIREGKMMMLTGGVRPEQFFDEDVISAVAHRFGQSERASIRKYGLEWAQSKAVSVENMDIDRQWQAAAAQGKPFRLRNGAMARLEKTEKGQRLWIGDQAFRRPDPKYNAAAVYDPAHTVHNTEMYSSFYPEEVAELIETMGKPFQTDEDIGKLLRAADTASRIWKGLTLFHPSWTVNDILGNLILASFAGINLAKLVAFLPDAFRIVLAHNRGDFDALERGTFRAGERGWKYADTIQGGLQGGGASSELLAHTIRNGVYEGPTAQRLYRNPKKWFDERANRARRRAQLAADAGRVADAGGLKNVTGLMVDEAVVRGLWQPWARINGFANDWIRTAAFMAMLDEGNDVQSAARRITEKMLDMSTLTAAEQNIRRIVPFYSWLKNSGVYGVRQLMENPKFFTIAPNLKRNLEEAINGEDTVPQHLRPAWIRDQLALQVGDDPEGRWAVTLQTMLPSEAATYFMTGVASPLMGQAALQDSAHFFASSLTPLLRMPLEIASGREWYSKREISGRPDEGDMSVSEYVAGQIRPLREFGVGTGRPSPLGKAYERSVGEGAARSIFGGRLQPIGDERLRSALLREFKPKEETIRRRMRVAERDGNREKWLAGQVRLLSLYRAMEQKGLGDEVPKKYRAAVQSLAS